MLRNKLVRSDGSIIDSSVIISCEFTEEVNSDENLSVGDVTSSEINVEMRSTDMVEQDETLAYYIIEDGVETCIGVFNVEKPTVATRTSIKFSAYDNIVKSEKVFSGWLRDNRSLFPMTLGELVVHACEYCGLTLATTAFPQSELEIGAFYADGITCRQILSWASAIAGRFVRANSNGEIEFAWYTDATYCTVAPSATTATTRASYGIDVTDDGAGNVNMATAGVKVSDDGKGNVTIEIPAVKVLYNNGAVSIATEWSVAYKQGSLSHEAYSTETINRVQIKQSEDDVGVIYPYDATGNCFAISENMLLATCTTEAITQVATSLYNHLCEISYVPVKATLPRTIAIRAGDIVNVRDPHGTVMTTYVMKVSVTPSGTTIESTGDKSYDTNAVVAYEKYKNLTGRILEITKSIDGLEIANKDLEGKVGSLELSTTEFKTYVGETFVSEDEFGAYQESVSTQFSQTKDSFEMKFESTKQDISDVASDLQAEHDERVSFIRFEDGNIILGQSDSDILLIQKNDRISFVRNVADKPEVAWFADDMLHVTEGQFSVQLGIGKFGFRPGPNGNLSFKKVVS
jgi:hypothetical protein